MKCFMGVFVMFVAALSGVPQTIAADQAADKTTIEKAVASYTAAFNARDAKALATHWSAEAVYINPMTGSQVEGREAIAKEFEAILAQLKGTKLAVDVESIRFISPRVAVENGVARLISADGQPQESTYTAIHVKEGGKWFLDRVTEEDASEPPSRYEQLKGLEWMIGDWVDEAGGAVVKTECNWTKNKNYLLRAFTISVEDRVNLSGMQLVGWDPARKKIRSWVFDSDGGFAEGAWKKNGKRWLIRTKATLPDGTQASSTSILEPLDKDRFTWQKVNRVVDGEILPSIDPVVIVRN